MLLTTTDAGLLALSFAAPLLLVLLAMPRYLRFLAGRGRVVDDVHKQPATKVPSPAGPLLFVALVVGELVAYFSFGSMVPVALFGVATVAFAVGVLDDFFVLGGKAKPLLLILAALPLVISVFVQKELYEPSLSLPLLGATSEHFSIYTILVLASFPVVANAFNMMDAFNGEISWFTLIASAALLFGVVLRLLTVPGFQVVRVAVALPLVAVAAGFLVFNRYPSRAFDGNSGSLLFGACYASLAILGGVEIAAVVAIVPAILNSFYILSSLRGFIERRRMGARPTYAGEDGRLYASKEPSAPVTLVRMILLGGPLTEAELVRAVTVLTLVAFALSVVTSVMTWVV